MTRKTDELRIRVRPELKRRLELAATVVGESLSEFVRGAARSEAGRILEGEPSRNTEVETT